ncbi:hypothetical protein HF086_017583 [Spodoptera exigua]|uniref:SH2 domain-containing protein n=1 Tax=Spodoptera exigua TaxID=7107 RepID=A0A922SHF5_SPOEX|nr:hypothetical protein HF086_017583 [Spodoptera exigua]
MNSSKNSREDDRVSHYIINRVVSADGTIRFRIGDQLFADMPALLAFYRLHYLDTTPLVRPLPQALAKVAAPPPQQPHQVLELVIAKFDFSGNILDPSGVPYPPAEALNHLADPPSPPSNKHPQQRTNMQVTKININGQWEGELHGKIGHFPFTCVEFLDENQAS